MCTFSNIHVIQVMNLIGCHFVLQYLNGHSDVIMGALLMDSERLHSKLAAVQVFIFVKSNQIKLILMSWQFKLKTAIILVF